MAPPHLNVIDGEEVREARVEARRLEKQRSMHHTKEVKERDIRGMSEVKGQVLMQPTIPASRNKGGWRKLNRVIYAGRVGRSFPLTSQFDREVLQAAHAFASLPDEVSSHLMGSLLGPTLAIQRMRKSAAITRRRKGLMSRDLAEESERMSLLGHAAAHGGAV